VVRERRYRRFIMKDKIDSTSPDCDFPFPAAYLNTLSLTSPRLDWSIFASHSLWRDWCTAREVHDVGESGGVVTFVCAWWHSRIFFELNSRLRVSNGDSRKCRRRSNVVAMHGKLRISIFSLVGGGILRTETLRSLRLL
jgi:hypothetical protein